MLWELINLLNGRYKSWNNGLLFICIFEFIEFIFGKDWWCSLLDRGILFSYLFLRNLFHFREIGDNSVINLRFYWWLLNLILMEVIYWVFYWNKGLHIDCLTKHRLLLFIFFISIIGFTQTIIKVKGSSSYIMNILFIIILHGNRLGSSSNSLLLFIRQQLLFININLYPFIIFLPMTGVFFLYSLYRIIAHMMMKGRVFRGFSNL